MIEVFDVKKTLGQKEVLGGLNFQVNKGEFVTLLGPSGCGKSTILNILSGHLLQDQGRIHISDPAHQGVPRVAYMPQEDLLLEHMSVLDNICLYAKLHHMDKKSIAKQWMKRFGLHGYESSYPRVLSGGMRQRAAFLRTAMCDFDVLLLDEPFGALDVITREEMQDFLLEFTQLFQKTIVFVTHDIEEAIYLSDRVYILSSKPAVVVEEIALANHEKTRTWVYENISYQAHIREVLRQYKGGQLQDV